ncbi:MAG: hypothetical protein AB7S72_14965 [Draconibacterium sp.]
MKKWHEEIIAEIDIQIEKSKEKDIRFFRVEEFSRNVVRVDEFSANCDFCKNQKNIIEEVLPELQEAVEIPGQSRRKFDRLSGDIATHMRKKHGFYPPYFHLYIYLFAGISAGLLVGLMLFLLITPKNENFIYAGFMVGILSGYFSGNIKDRKVREAKKIL